MKEYNEKDLSKRFAKVFNLPEAQVLVMKDADDGGYQTVAIMFHIKNFGTMALNLYPEEGETYDELFKRATRTNDMAKEALKTVLAEVNLLAEQVEREQKEQLKVLEVADGEPEIIEVENSEEEGGGTGSSDEEEPVEETN